MVQDRPEPEVPDPSRPEVGDRSAPEDRDPSRAQSTNRTEPQTARPVPARRRRAWTVVPAAVGAALVLADAVAVLNPGHWVVVEDVYAQRWWLALLACLVFAVAALLGVRGSSRRGLTWRVVAATLASVAGVGSALALFASAYFFPSDLHQTQRVAAPGDRPRQAIVEQGSDIIDTVWTVSVESGHGLGRRRWDAACFDADDSTYAFKSVDWTGPDQVRLTSEGAGAFTVHLAGSGRPSPSDVPDDFSC
jgi:hypothetical protein